ncbi:hypothetical protein N7931_14100 [Catenovulum sp. 2E275]|uniref:hypothetical protein n=1 Tax=Catenovulum sp. 2E275 TaxID=2980497 RepID=UPI0021D1DF1C|nr:hypothetical protein [Catenovulum sp. 2E275]MCU4676761.1 hypothetical protein [Catenovulum sp. 2E275]
MKSKLICSTLLIAFSCSQAYAGDKEKMPKEERKALMQECKEAAEAENIDKAELRKWVKQCIKEKMSQK